MCPTAIDLESGHQLDPVIVLAACRSARWVAYGTDPERVLKLLVEVAKSKSGVMINPEPMAFFLGFGESALNFELRFWSARQETWFQLKSDVAVAVAKALREAGIEIPFPQRDLHVRSIGASVKETLTGDMAQNSFSAPARKSESTPLPPPDPAGEKKL